MACAPSFALRLYDVYDAAQFTRVCLVWRLHIIISLRLVVVEHLVGSYTVCSPLVSLFGYETKVSIW